MLTLKKRISNLGQFTAHREISNPVISKASVGWHIEHCLLTINYVIDALDKSNPADYKPRSDYRRLLVMLFGIIPRGKVRAPKKVQPALMIDELTLAVHFANTERNLELLGKLESQKYFTHPFLGDFKLKPAIKFLSIHTNHHLKIIKDIINKTREPKSI